MSLHTCSLSGLEWSLMAGSARYRDLLTSASQITQLRSSSLKLSGSLRQVAASCSMADTAVTAEGSVDGDADDAVSMLPVAAHMKLLLDAPEGTQRISASTADD